ncbi:MAG TPA: flagellar biosynthesis protein FlhA, partial [Chroococcales cyanobacterium]
MNRLFQQTDVLLSIGVVLIVVMMIVPLSTGLLDALLVLNIALSLTILVVSLYVLEPVQFSTFPSILLLATLFRLALNISTTRLILLNGDAGHVVAAFGNFVVGGNYAVGIVIFLIIMVIQFVVITNGAGRIAEVTARFTLDAMPGKQMAIDADLNAGMIDENEARARRKKIRQEADFYGTMDGAAKFVRGDAIAALVMVAVNILGGFAIGVLQRHVDIFQALQTYTLLSIGDGLVSQIPALMISSGTGLLVSRAASEVNLGENIASQFAANPKAMAVVAGSLIAMGLVPALPKIPFFLIGGLLAYGYFFFSKRQKAEAEKAKTVETVGPEAPKGPENVMGLLQIDPIELEIGYRLIPLVDATQGGDLLERIALIRRQTALKLGLVLPAIRVRDNLQLRPKDYRINLRGIEIARSEVHVDHFMAMSPGLATEQLEGIPAIEPVFGLPTVWISENQKDYAEMLGYTVFDSSAVISTHLTEVIKNHAHEILGRQDVQLLIDNIKKDHPTVIEELIPDILSVGDIQRILQNLLRERVSI